MKTVKYTHKPEGLNVVEVTLDNVEGIATACGYVKYTIDRIIGKTDRSSVRFYVKEDDRYGKFALLGSYVGIPDNSEEPHVFYETLEEVEKRYEKKEKSAGKRRKSDAVRGGVAEKDPCKG